MSPHHVAEESNRYQRVDHHPVAQQRPAHAVDEDVGDDAHCRNDGDVDLRMTKEPEQVLPKQRRTAGVRLHLVADHQIRRNEEAGSGNPVKNKQQTCRQQDRERQQTNAGSDEPGPGAQRHAHQCHASRAQVERSRDEVQRSEQLPDAEYGN